VTRPRVVLRRLRRSDLAAFQADRHDPELGPRATGEPCLETVCVLERPPSA
jgi:hypothetical protein